MVGSSSAAVSLRRSGSRRPSGDRGRGVPSTNAVGVVTTPARTPSEVALDALGHGVGAPVGLEALEVEAERLGARPQVRVLEAALVGEQRVVHLPERALARGRLGRARRGPGARVLGAHREVAEGDAAAAGRCSRSCTTAQYGHSKSA